MFRLHNLSLLESVAKAEPTPILLETAEQHQARNEQVSAQARGEARPDMERDQAKYEDHSAEAAKDSAELLQVFHRPEQDRLEPPPSVLANCDGVAVPQASPVWKSVFKSF